MKCFPKALVERVPKNIAGAKREKLKTGLEKTV
jgi:hypothetical protein